MDLGETGTNIILGIVIVLFLALNIYFRSRRTAKTSLTEKPLKALAGPSVVRAWYAQDRAARPRSTPTPPN